MISSVYWSCALRPSRMILAREKNQMFSSSFHPHLPPWCVLPHRYMAFKKPFFLIALTKLTLTCLRLLPTRCTPQFPNSSAEMRDKIPQPGTSQPHRSLRTCVGRRIPMFCSCREWCSTPTCLCVLRATVFRFSCSRQTLHETLRAGSCTKLFRSAQIPCSVASPLAKSLALIAPSIDR
ncbi:hypothetical protein PSPO01_06965 [Paraphaeosphaeria sporulosa]